MDAFITRNVQCYIIILAKRMLVYFLLIHWFNSIIHWIDDSYTWGVLSIMTSSNWNIFRVTGHLCGEFTGPRWIPCTKASDAELWCFLWSASEYINGWENNCEAGDLRRYRAHYDVNVMVQKLWWCNWSHSRTPEWIIVNFAHCKIYVIFYCVPTWIL